MDMFDGRVARFTATGSPVRRGAGLAGRRRVVRGGARALVYFAFLHEGEWSWIVVFLYIVAAILRLARFNIEQAGTDKHHFHGLPSPISGSCLATFYAFTQTDFWVRFFPGVTRRGRRGGWRWRWGC
jgi:CDP-diacylglycerol--serine O-phosphatidyltransferase